MNDIAQFSPYIRNYSRHSIDSQYVTKTQPESAKGHINGCFCKKKNSKTLIFVPFRNIMGAKNL